MKYGGRITRHNSWSREPAKEALAAIYCDRTRTRTQDSNSLLNLPLFKYTRKWYNIVVMNGICAKVPLLVVYCALRTSETQRACLCANAVENRPLGLMKGLAI